MAKQVRDYQVVDSDGRIVLSRIDMANDFTVEGANNGLGWAGGVAPFKVYASVVGSGDGYGLIGEVEAGAARSFQDTGIDPDLGQRP